MVNNQLFTDFGRKFRAGEFAKLRKDSLEFRQLWAEQLSRCVNGYMVGGKYMSGLLYGYVNFGTIRKRERNTQRKVSGPPDLRDWEWEMDYYIQDCLRTGHGLLALTGRRVGKTSFMSWVNVDSYTFHSDLSMVGFGNEKKGHQFMDSIRLHLNGLAETQFRLPVLTDQPYGKGIIAGYKVYVTDGDSKKRIQKEEKYGGVIRGINFGPDFQAANGLSTHRAVFEEVGVFPNLIQAYSASEPCWSDGSQNFGMPILIGTGGDMEEGTRDAAQMFEDPDTYNLKAFEDSETPGKRIALWFPGYMNYNEFRDSEGVMDHIAAKDALLKKRAQYKKGKNLERLRKFMMYHPLTWREIFLRSSGNRFPVGLIQEQITTIMSDSELVSMGVRGALWIREGEVVFEPDLALREVPFPVRKGDEDAAGCLTVYEAPVQGADGRVPAGLYKIGVDPYMKDRAPSSVSLGSAMVYKKVFDPANQKCRWVVAEDTGRPATSDEYHERVRRLALYYNAEILMENNIDAMGAFFKRKNCAYLLIETPSFQRSLYDESKESKTHGFYMDKHMKLYIEDKIANWLQEETPKGSGVYGVNRVFSVELLKELLYYDSNSGNFDRVVSFGAALLAASEGDADDVEMVEAQQVSVWSYWFDRTKKAEAGDKQKEAGLATVFDRGYSRDTGTRREDATILEGFQKLLNR